MIASDDGILTLGNYKLVEVLGVGAMGYVYRARQINLERDVAVKILLPKLAQETGYLDLFFREARTAASLEHPHIVPVFDYGIQQNVSYVAMRLLVGGSLGERLQYRLDHGLPLPSLPEIIAILTQAATALDYAHARGVIHRDIKPTNLMFDQHGVVYVVDFGIAKLLGTTSSINGGTFLGTPSFMAPEQWEGLAPTPAVDQYALGAVIYMMLTGHPPFESETPFALMTKHLNEFPPDIREYRPNLPAQVNDVLLTAMAKRAEDRFPTVMAFAQAFTETVQNAAGEKPTEFMTYPLPQTPFTFPFPTPTGQPAITAALPSEPTMALDESTVRLPLGGRRNLLLWIETALLVFSVALIALLLIQRSTVVASTPDPASSAALVALPSASPTSQEVPLSSAGDDQDVALLQAVFTPTAASVITSAVSDPPTFTFTPTDTPTDTPTLTPTPTPESAPRPTVHWNAGTPLRINNQNGAWLRSRPSTGARQVATLAYNNPVTSTGNYSFDGYQWWWQVKASWGAVGWVEQYSLIQN